LWWSRVEVVRLPHGLALGERAVEQHDRNVFGRLARRAKQCFGGSRQAALPLSIRAQRSTLRRSNLDTVSARRCFSGVRATYIRTSRSTSARRFRYSMLPLVGVVMFMRKPPKRE